MAVSFLTIPLLENLHYFSVSTITTNGAVYHFAHTSLGPDANISSVSHPGLFSSHLRCTQMHHLPNRKRPKQTF